MAQLDPLPAGTKPTRCQSLRLLRLLLLCGAVYAALLLCWDVGQLGQLTAPAEVKSTAKPSMKLVSVSTDTQAASPVESAEEAEQHARSVKILPPNETRLRNWRCIGWKATRDCSPYGPREVKGDLSCSRRIPNGDAGYCELEDIDSGERFRVMRRYCGSLRNSAQFRCGDAAAFANFPMKAKEVVEKALAPGYTLPNIGSGADGIVMVVYPKMVASAYATLKTLRELFGCRLPIEIWYRPREISAVPAALAPLQGLARNQTYEGEITFHEIGDAWAMGFTTKIYAIYNSFFDRVLFLDADNVPVRDPSFLFEAPEFVDTGALFWPDFWHPKRTIFNINAHSPLWEMLSMPFPNMFEQESGQLLIDRRRHTASLELVFFYAFHQPNHFKKFSLVHGDKDLFRLAWMKLDVPFHMILYPPAVAGKVINESFCGMTMVQHDTQGEILFLHRNSNKLTGGPPMTANERLLTIRRKRNKRLRIAQGLDTSEAEQPTPEPAGEADAYPDPIFWSHILSFNRTSRQSNYFIETYNAYPEFPKEQNCYGQRELGKNKHFYAQEVANMTFAGLETSIRHFAFEAVQLQKEAQTLAEKSSNTKPSVR